MSTDDTLTTLGSLAKAIADGIDALDRDIDEIRMADARAESLPITLGEIETRIPAVVHGRRKLWLERYGQLLIGALGSPKHGARLNTPFGVDFARELATFDAYLSAHPDRAIEMLLALVRAVPFEAGAPATERPALVARLREELAVKEAKREAAVDTANAHGLTIEHRPEVIQRRQEEERQRQAEERRRQRQRELDEQARAQTRGPRVVHSPYLQEQNPRDLA